MGALLAVIAEVAEVSAVSGLSVDALLSGEALASAELIAGQVEAISALEGLSAVEAAATLGFSAENYNAIAALASLPNALSGIVGADLVFNGTSVVAAAISTAVSPYTYDYSVPITNLNVNMALQVWQPDLDDLNFPGVMPFVRFLNYIDPMHWAGGLFRALGRYFWQNAQRQGQQMLEGEFRELAQRTATSISETLALYFENARWAVRAVPTELYGRLQQYYAELPPLNPPQLREVSRRTANQPFQLYDKILSNVESAHYVTKVDPPGGANQRQTPDWLLPLILGLYGDISPSWETTLEELEEEEDGPKKKKQRPSTKTTPHRSSKTYSKRRH
ncbi:VP2 minor capsid protein [Bat polyomavirus 6c]|uniref:Minor capsid protein n=1 Tax=Bat polyomavirus 6c TaxID=1623688 RepID=A0A0D5ZYE0_9POLY|nr:VP2 minor capsid protein [Bat polyomavirus 6c]BAQ55570.1 VP2 minor capsid protein [Bat polyomavirus 6c]